MTSECKDFFGTMREKVTSIKCERRRLAFAWFEYPLELLSDLLYLSSVWNDKSGEFHSNGITFHTDFGIFIDNIANQLMYRTTVLVFLDSACLYNQHILLLKSGYCSLLKEIAMFKSCIQTVIIYIYSTCIY